MQADISKLSRALFLRSRIGKELNNWVAMNMHVQKRGVLHVREMA